MNDLALSSYDYPLPRELIATHPANPPESARLLVYNRAKESIIHSDFSHFSEFLPEQTTIVFNTTKVIKARIFGYKMNKTSNFMGGGKIEMLFHRVLENGRILGQFRGKLKEGESVDFGHNTSAKILKDLGDGFKECEFYSEDKEFLSSKNQLLGALNNVKFDKNGNIIAQNPLHKLSGNEVLDFLQKHGQTPLPPYIKRELENTDENDYQSVFARTLGSIAAPTASLHFNANSWCKILNQFQCAEVCLHVGAGTFLGVSKENILEHKMHYESFFVEKENAAKIAHAKHITAIGTTATRVVEFLAKNDILNDNLNLDSINNLNSIESKIKFDKNRIFGECDLFLNPSNKPQKVDSILTNFHLPKTTLLMLVASFIGLEKTLEIYNIAIKEKYRFFSYGDAMLIL